MIRDKGTYFLALAAGLLVSFVPVLGDFHFESALLAGTAGAFLAAWKAADQQHDGEELLAAAGIVQHLYVFSLPLFLFSLFSGCFTNDAFGFWILTPIPSVFFGLAAGRFFRKTGFPKPRLFGLLFLSWVSVGVLGIEFFTLPQVYYFNHVWGAWPGPIYDESVTISTSYLVFRMLTIGWIAILWFLPDFRKAHDVKFIVLILIAGMLMGYLNLAGSGIITPRSYLKKKLHTEVHTAHFDIYAAPEQFNEQELEYWAAKQEFYFNHITKALEIDWPEGHRIESYFYGNAWQKKALVGAKFTSYVPVWLTQDQLHIAKEHLHGVLMHEMVHVISKQFGNDLFNASWSIGLIEGLAEGIARDASNRSTLDQILAANPPYPTSKQMQNALSLSGFYGGASGVSYTTAGSFVSYLLDEYPVQQFKEAYRTNRFEEAYQLPFDSLVAGWRRTLPEEKIDSVDREVSQLMFSQRSILQKTCPHSVSEEMELWDRYRYFETVGDTSKALSYLEKLHERAPQNLLIKQRWAGYKLQAGETEAVIQDLALVDSMPAFSFLKGDAFALMGRMDSARSALPSRTELNGRYKQSMAFRQDSTQWHYFLNTRYASTLPKPDEFTMYHLANQMQVIQKAIELHTIQDLPAYSAILVQNPIDPDWFDVYVALIDRLIFLKEFDAAHSWLSALEKFDLRPRYIERLQLQKEWLQFIQRPSY